MGGGPVYGLGGGDLIAVHFALMFAGGTLNGTLETTPPMSDCMGNWPGVGGFITGAA